MSSSLHRLHVEFDDLSVVDEEEEELKRDKERKEVTPSEEGQKNEAGRHPPPPILGPRQLHDNIPFYPATYEPTSGFSGTSYYTECPYEFPSTVDLMLPTDTSALLASPCPGLQPDPLIPLPGLDVGLDQLADPMLPQIHVPPVGWQSDVLSQDRLPAYANIAASIASTTGTQISSPLENSMSSDPFSCLKRRNASVKPMRLQDASTFHDSRTQLFSSREAIDRNVWGFATNSTNERNAMTNSKQDTRIENQSAEEITASKKPKHFFAPLSFKLKKQEEESPTAGMSHFGTGTSSSSGKTASTVISRTNPFLGQKGSADIYVNGAIPYENENASKNRYDSKASLSTNNLYADNKNILNGQLMKSISCQNLSSESQDVGQQLNHIESQMLTKSDNNLDSITSSSANKPYKSHLNVTLKIPRAEQAPSPETPEIPNLPSIDYRLFRNPFLRNFDKICSNHQAEPNSAPTATPLSVQVNDDGLAYQYPMSTYGRGIHRNEKLRTTYSSDQNRLLIPSDQLTSGKQDIQVTSFEKPSPCTLIPSTGPYDLTTLRRLNANRYLQSQNLYQNVSFMPRGSSQLYPQRGGMMYYDNVTKVTAQTQTSIDGDSHQEDERQNEETVSAPNSPSGRRQKKVVKKDKSLIKDQGSLMAQRRLKKQSSATSTDILDSPTKVARKQPRKLSTIISDVQEDKNESRSSSSGQDSPRKDRRVSVHINSKKRSSQTSLKTATRSGSVDATKDKDGTALNSERERTNSVSSRETAGVKARKTSTSSGNVPWCACWGNGCI